jgi:predicted nucleotidyltransferase
VFGSVARGDDCAQSHVDLVVDMDLTVHCSTLWGMVRISKSCSTTAASLDPAFRDRILAVPRSL